MRSSPLERKIVRPGLTAYSFYSSDRHIASQAQTNKAARTRPRRGSHMLVLVVLVALAAIVGFKSATSQSGSITSPPGLPAYTIRPGATSPCSGNSHSQFILVSIGQRRLWACNAAKAAYTSPVITGMANLAADTTPTGTYKIYAKQTNVTLTGSDTTGSWNDPVHYWMPFLDNQYGTYGFHDATWRPNTAFGTISPYSSNASHGCVEVPLATSKWLYNWAPVGTVVTIEN